MDHFSENLIKIISSYCSKEVYLLYYKQYGVSKLIGIYDSKEKAEEVGNKDEEFLYECAVVNDSSLSYVRWKKEYIEDSFRYIIPASDEEKDNLLKSLCKNGTYKYIKKKKINQTKIPFTTGCMDNYRYYGEKRMCGCKE